MLGAGGVQGGPFPWQLCHTFVIIMDISLTTAAINPKEGCNQNPMSKQDPKTTMIITFQRLLSQETIVVTRSNLREHNQRHKATH